MTEERSKNVQIELWIGRAGASRVGQNDRLRKLLSSRGKHCMDILDFKCARRVLDVGSGCGGQTLALARRVPQGCKIMAMDVSNLMLESVDGQHSKLSRGLPGRIDYLQVDASDDAFAPKCFYTLSSYFEIIVLWIL